MSDRQKYNMGLGTAQQYQINWNNNKLDIDKIT